MTVRLISVAVPVPLLDQLSYRLPDGHPNPPVGARVVVPLGTRRVVGVVTGHPPGVGTAPVSDSATGPAGVPEGTVLRDVDRVIDDEPFLPPSVVGLSCWVAEYYACGIGEALAAALPPGARSGQATMHRTVRVARLTPAGLRLRRDAEARSVQPREADASGPTTSREGSGLGPRQWQALEAIPEGPDGVAVARLGERGVSPDTVRRLAHRGLVALSDERTERDPTAWSEAPVPGPSGQPLEDAGRELTAEQGPALARLTRFAAGDGYRTVLLHGVTASGKTELYLRLAASVIEAGRQVLVLVPEIALTPAVAGAFRRSFGDRVAIQHSGLSNGERHDQWHRIRRGAVDVVVGTRSAVFAPLARPGLIVVDEEHDTSFKQEESPRYHGRDVAVMRGRREGALVVLGSATPSLESYQNARAGRYDLIELTRRVHDRPLAHVRVVNMRDEYAERGPDAILSATLVEALRARVAVGEQSLVLLNRRGYATSVFCRQCSEPIQCPHCSVSLTLHDRPGGRRRGRCHYCNFAMDVPGTCPRCASPYMTEAGFGTERIEEEVRAAVPGARVARLDRDTVRRRGAAPAMLRRFGAGEIDVLIGTQMIAKGHDFPRVTLVGVVSADVGLGLADFRAAERTFQLLTQVVGRAGRGDRPGEAIIQTLFPEHYGIRLACRQDYVAFFERELEFRRAMRYPPVLAMVNAVVSGRLLTDALEAAGRLARRLRHDAVAAGAAFVVVGPAPAPLVKLKGAHRAQFFLKGVGRAAMRQALGAVLVAMPELRRRVTIDVDPLNVL